MSPGERKATRSWLNNPVLNKISTIKHESRLLFQRWRFCFLGVFSAVWIWSWWCRVLAACSRAIRGWLPCRMLMSIRVVTPFWFRHGFESFHKNGVYRFFQNRGLHSKVFVTRHNWKSVRYRKWFYRMPPEWYYSRGMFQNEWFLIVVVSFYTHIILISTMTKFTWK